MCSTVRREFIMCRNCPQRTQGKPSNIPDGYYYDTLNGVQILKECSCHVKWRKANEVYYKLINANLKDNPYGFEDYKGTRSLEDVRALEYMSQHFDKFLTRKMIYLYGPNGTQKTSMSQALGKSLIEQGYKVQYILMQELLNNLMPDFDETDNDKKAVIKRYMETDLLIIDEAFDKSKVTLYNSGYQIPFLDNFLRTRFEINKGSILFISNKKPEEISNQGFGESLQNFVIRNTRGSYLIFEDKYIENTCPVDRLSLFK